MEVDYYRCNIHTAICEPKQTKSIAAQNILRKSREQTNKHTNIQKYIHYIQTKKQKDNVLSM